MKSPVVEAFADMKFAVIGCGNMGGALVRGLVNSFCKNAEQICGCDSDNEKLEALKQELGIRIAAEPASAAKGVNYIILAVKPKLVAEVLQQIAKSYSKKDKRPILISVAAGTTISTLSEAWGKKEGIVRIMPNLPVIVGQGMCGVYSDDETAADQAAQIFSAVGATVILSAERELDAVTALSACGPAYVAMFISALADGGVKMGLTREVAQLLAVQTVYGTAGLINDSGVHPNTIREQVASPGGTTIAGLHVLEDYAFRAGVISAVEAATLRAIEISEVS